MAIAYNHDHDNEITLFAETNFRNQRRRFGIKTDDRRRHMYLIGKTGMGKTTLLENLILSDINVGHGCCYIDPHGDTAEKLTDFIPSHRINDVVYFNPSDTAFPMGFNILETDNDDQKPLVASGLMGVFKKIWPDVWSARMEYILMNCVLALLDYPGATLMGINRLLVDKEYRSRVVAKIRDPIVKTFWIAEFASWSEKYATEAIAPVQNKVGQFLSSSVVRNIVAQVKSTINIRRIMDDGKILIVNLSKGRIGEDNMRLLGGMLITKIQLAAQERQNIPKEDDRRDFYLYVDEFQNFANESFATILSEARKYRLNLVVAHQYIEQLDEKVAAAIFGNVGTIITMRIGGADAEKLETEFGPNILPEDLVNLTKFQIYLKLMVDGVATMPFSANTLGPISKRTANQDKVIAVSRERYSEPRAIIEEKVLKWSGMELAISGVEVNQDGVPVEAEAGLTPVEPAKPIAYQPSYPRLEVEEERLQREADEAVIKGAKTPVPQTAPVQPAPRTLTARAPEPHEPDQEDAKEYLKINPERLAAIQSSIPQQQQKKAKPQYPHTCTRCGKVWNLPVQLDPTRPMYCAECRPIILEEKKRAGESKKQVYKDLPPLSQIRDEEKSETQFAGKSQAATMPANRPRIVTKDATKGDDIVVPPAPKTTKEREERSRASRPEPRKKDEQPKTSRPTEGRSQPPRERIQPPQIPPRSPQVQFQQRDQIQTPPKKQVVDDQIQDQSQPLAPGATIQFD